jgi:hypothetical protein
MERNKICIKNFGRNPLFRRGRRTGKATISFVTCVRPSVWKNLTPTARIFTKFDIRVFSPKKLSRKFKLHCYLTWITSTLSEDQRTFMITSRWIPLRMRNVSDKSCRENHNTLFKANNPIPLKSCSLRENVEKYGTARLLTGDNPAHAHLMLDT